VSGDSQKRLGEFALIETLFSPLAAAAPGAAALKDDAALLSVPAGAELVATVDTLVESVHFRRIDPPDLIARKGLRVNLSDLAAKGARPENYLLALSLASWIDDEWLRRFADGLAADQKEFGITLVGGDTTATPGPLTFSITAFGSVPAGRILRRAGAAPGDCVFVSGTIGDAGAGLEMLEAVPPTDLGQPAGLAGRYLLPQPRAALGSELIGLASASLDVSDGLIADLGHIAAASGVHIEVEAARIPLSAALQSLWGTGMHAIVRAATAGDDYEIAFTAPPSVRAEIGAVAARTGIPVTEIGRVLAGQGVTLHDSSGRPMALARPGYSHR
jgi:thiamine-monophosphate kinase